MKSNNGLAQHADKRVSIYVKFVTVPHTTVIYRLAQKSHYQMIKKIVLNRIIAYQ